MSAQKGRIEAANGGTLLLIGVDELCPEQQSAILRFLQEGLIERLGSNHPISVDTRLIATSTKPLEQLVKTGDFRSDVFYRLGSLHVFLPPLRDRREDIPVLANRMLSATPSANGARRLSDAAMICLAEHPGPATSGSCRTACARHYCWEKAHRSAPKTWVSSPTQTITTTATENSH